MNKINKNIELIDLSEIERIENLHKVIFPEDYKIHMLEFNGGTPISKLYFNPEEWGDEIKLSYLLPIKHSDYTFEEANIEGELKNYPENCLLIGHTLTGALAISFKEEEIGSIYIFYPDGEMHKLTDSFTEFLEELKEL